MITHNAAAYVHYSEQQSVLPTIQSLDLFTVWRFDIYAETSEPVTMKESIRLSLGFGQWPSSTRSNVYELDIHVAGLRADPR